MDRFGEDGSLDENVESFFHDNKNLVDRVGRCMDVTKGMRKGSKKGFYKQIYYYININFA